MVPIGLFVLFGALALLAAADEDDMELMLAGIAILFLTGLLMSPNIIMYAIKESKDWESRVFKDKKGKSFENKLYKESFFYKIEYPASYHDKIVSGVIRESVLNFGGLIILIAVVLGGYIITFLFGFSRDSHKAFAYITAILVFLIPAFTYNLSCSIYRIRTVLRREYFVCHAVVSEVDNFEMRITGENDIYKFNYCRCLGIRAKDVHDTKAILAFVPDEVYLFPDKGWP